MSIKYINKFFLTLALLFAGYSIQAQDSVPSIEINNLEGKKVNIRDYTDNGKITVFSFWATWCGPCKKELSNIADLYEEWQEAYDVEVVAVNIDNSRNVAKVKPYVNGQAWPFDVLLDTNEDLKRGLNFQSVPYTILFDSEGNVAYEHNGYLEGDEYTLEEEIKALSEK